MPFTQPSRFLGDLVAETEGARMISGDAATTISGVTQDTRRLAAGDLFVAVPGLERDGLEFVPRAVANGAAALAAERLPWADPGVPQVLVSSARRALADLSAAFYGHPSRHTAVVGVTGTDGKTSTTQLLSAILEAHGLRTGWLTTINTKIGGELRTNAADHTTPEAPLVQRTLAEMVAARLDVAILETSSHALELDRVRSVHYRVGIFTNLSPEHLNFHGSFEAYRAAKQKLFERLGSDGLAVLNADDPSALVLRAATRARVLTYGFDTATATVCATNVHLAPDGTLFTLIINPCAAAASGRHEHLPTHGTAIEVQTRLVGRFNVANWLAAYAAATAFGATPADLVRAAAAQPPVPGRMNLVHRGQPFAVVVDFAHTPQALEKALDTVRSLLGPDGRVLLAFGLAGGRDRGNRAVMGELAARKADLVAVTMDDPYDEDPAAIAADILAGARDAQHDARFVVELDRRVAIRLLLNRARPGDAVLLAGKGHEQRMVVGTERRPWSDLATAGELLVELGYGSQAVP